LKDGNPAAVESNTVFYLYGCHLLLTGLSAAARQIRCCAAISPAAWPIRWKSVEVADMTARRMARRAQRLQDAKIASAEAQNAGQVGTKFPPGFLLTTMLALATAWTTAKPFGPSLDPAVLRLALRALR
jgi:hypothetical protein